MIRFKCDCGCYYLYTGTETVCENCRHWSEVAALKVKRPPKSSPQMLSYQKRYYREHQQEKRLKRLERGWS